MDKDAKITARIGAIGFGSYVAAILIGGVAVACSAYAFSLIRAEAPTDGRVVLALFGVSSVLIFVSVGQWLTADRILDSPDDLAVTKGQVRRARRDAEALLAERRPAADRRWSGEDWQWAFDQLDSPAGRSLASRAATVAALKSRDASTTRP